MSQEVRAKFFRAALFDLDGTLLDTLADLSDSLNEVLAEEGLPTHGYDDYRLMIGHGQRMLVTRALPEDRRGEDSLKLIMGKFSERYRAAQFSRTRPYPGLPEALAALKAKKIRLAVLSNKPQANASAVVAHYFPGVFEAVWGLGPERPAKPDPSSALALAGTLGLAPEDCLFAGDSDVDMKTARRAGMWPVGVTWGYRRRDELLAAGAACLLDEPGALPALCPEPRQ